MSIFETSTTPDESPVIGQEETGTEEQQDLDAEDNQQYADPEGDEEAEESPSDDSEQGDEEIEDDPYVPRNTYNELRGAFTRKAQEAAELKRQLDQLQGQRMQPPDEGQGQQPPRTMAEFNRLMEQEIQRMREDGYHEEFIATRVAADTANFRLQLMEQERADQRNRDRNDEVNRNVETLRQEYKDLQTEEGMILLAGKVNEIAAELGNMELAKYPTKRLLQMAAKEVFGDNAADLYQKAKAKGKQEALDSIKAKQGLTTTTSKKPTEQPKTLEEQVADSIVGAGRKGGIFG